VIVLLDPDDYGWVTQHLRDADKSENGDDIISVEERKKLAQKAFQHVALYDTSIAQYLRAGDVINTEELTLGYVKLNDLRYGENPHQDASVWVDPMDSGGIVRGKRLHGIDMSYNNILDAEAAWVAVSDFHDQAVAVVKHMNSCGLAVHRHQPTAYRRAFEGDSMSAFGGIVGFNTKVTAETAEEMHGVLLDVIVAPEYDQEALNILKKRKSTRVIEVKPTRSSFKTVDFRTVSGGALVQRTDSICEDPFTWKVVTKKSPSDDQLKDLHFAVKAMKNIKSNSIVLAKDQSIVGMGAGQPNRVTSVHLGLRVAGEKAHGCVMASDAFFPFPDGIEMAANGGVVAVSQPGGSVNDDKVISAANDLGIVMMFTGVRHFKH
jgi:phosphoribosylaminoimidazolecarboxamide formyltransferase/IMP cyclohydrolase